MLLRRPDFALRGESVQCRDDIGARLLRLDDHVGVAALRRLVRRSEFLDVLRRLLILVGILAEDDVRSARRAHDGDFSRRPCHDLVRAELAAAHGDVGTAVRLARDDRDLGHRRLAVGVEHLRAVADDARVLLTDARQEARNIDEVDERDVERIAEADEACGLVGSVDVEAARHDVRLVRDDADGAAVEARETGDDVRREMLMHFVELAVVDDAADDVLHVVRCIRIVRNDRVQGLIHARRVVARLDDRRVVHVVARQEGEQVADLLDAVVLILRREMRDARDRVVRHGAAQGFRRDFFRRDRLDDGRSRDEHLARVLDHVDEVRDGRAVDSAARARSHDDGDLRHDARSRRVAVEDARIARKRVNGFLDACAARVVDADARSAHLHREIHDLPDLVRVLLAQGTALDREVLRESVDKAAVNRAVARDDALARQILLVLSEVRAAMLHEHVKLDEGVLIKELLDALASRHLALFMLLVDALLSAAQLDMFLLGVHEGDFFLNCSHTLPPLCRIFLVYSTL